MRTGKKGSRVTLVRGCHLSLHLFPRLSLLKKEELVVSMETRKQHYILQLYYLG